MWRVGWLVLASCGRIGFAELSVADAVIDTSETAQGFSQLEAHADQTCALYAGSAYCWGSNGASQIGDGTTMDAVVPTRVALPGIPTAITQGETHACAIVDGDAYCWGSVTDPIPTLITTPAPVTDISAGGSFTCLLADVVRCWGVNDVGQCGTGNMAPPAQPTPVAFAMAYPATSIDVGNDHGCADASDRAPQCWGHNDFGSMGTGSTTPAAVLVPGDVIGGVTTQPRIAGWHACALDAGTVWCWGEGQMGELGNGLQANSATPVLVAGLTNVTAVQVGGGPVDHDASCAIADGAVFCWGRGENGRLGNAMTTSMSTPVAVLGLPAAATSLGLGFGHACALLVDGDIWCWGRGDRGQLGDGNQASSLTPVKVVRPAS
ncbi:MAG TPA: hypothetical protein VIV11_02015 [Kofleriaceae bacterium]